METLKQKDIKDPEDIANDVKMAEGLIIDYEKKSEQCRRLAAPAKAKGAPKAKAKAKAKAQA